jgi:hypothetical protein
VPRCRVGATPARRRSGRPLATDAYVCVATGPGPPAHHKAARRLETSAHVCPAEHEGASVQSHSRRGGEGEGEQATGRAAARRDRAGAYMCVAAGTGPPAHHKAARCLETGAHGTCRARGSERSVTQSTGRRGRGRASHGASSGALGPRGRVRMRSRWPRPASPSRSRAPPRNERSRVPAEHEGASHLNWGGVMIS